MQAGLLSFPARRPDGRFAARVEGKRHMLFVRGRLYLSWQEDNAAPVSFGVLPLRGIVIWYYVLFVKIHEV